MPEFAVFILMVAVFVLAAALLKWPIGLCLMAAAVCGALAGGEGVPLRHLIEGSFGFFDVILIILTAVLFMKVLQASGSLDSLAAALLRIFYRRKVPLLLAAALLVMFPGMITGSSTASVLTSGPLVAPVLTRLGLSRLKTGAFIAMAAVLGMIAPPVNILVMIMGGGVDMPYVGVTLPLLIIVMPLAIAIPLWIGLDDVKVIAFEDLEAILPPSVYGRYGPKLYLPLVLVIGLMLGERVLVKFMPDPGIPGIFLVGSLIGAVCGRPFNFWKTTRKAVEEAMPILTILAGVGMFIQVLTLTGARGWIVTTFLALPGALLYPAIALGMPLFGGISAFGASSILGVPFILAMISKNALITSTALSGIVGLGDLVPPAALAGRFAGQIVGEKSFLRILKYCVVPALFVLGWALAVLLGAPILDRFI
ncbi:MAG TPA: Na+/H+ antiporter NhaC family protein [Acidobacteriota bacterium]|nr:Na+/H+ antiporter NhaC family protein [Acidobacteriota bacterium]